MFLDQLANPVDPFPAKAVAALQPDRLKPELRLAGVTLDVDVRRFASVTCVEEEPERPHAQYSRHVRMLQPPSAKSNTPIKQNAAGAP
jgi:hypothetical protein